MILLLIFTSVRYIYRHDVSEFEGNTGRYSNIELLMRESSEEISLAVLPFTNLTGDKEQEPIMPFTALGRAKINAILGNSEEAIKWLNSRALEMNPAIRNFWKN